ncbi:hypothetical protein JCM16774_1952 [Pseudoleptotrichia goodfellowii]|uniref:Uncharacterized protein n=1 Tax=Pseudoleptotrichia goodfellowii TaxID=157692 RepID=A0A510JD38_9FUSO|nr:hypothetical protein [Pseudoleptotrichia goodfellowii]BBM37006.1 hypothetical protein JCM16774_1952 [Pseudoleptotrichia goodfellowii]
MIENIKIYMRSNSKIYVCIDEEVFYHENESLEEVLEVLKEEYEFTGNKNPLKFILHFSYFTFNDKELNVKEDISTNEENRKILKNIYNKDFLDDFVRKNINSENKKLYLNHLENKFINVYLSRKKTSELKRVCGKFGFEILSIKIDFVSVYNFYKEENIEIIQIGEEKSLRFLIEDSKIKEIEKLDLVMEDISDIDNFDFGNMEVFTVDEENVKIVFQGSDLYSEPDFAKKNEIISMESIKNVKMKDIIILGILAISYFLLCGFIPLEKEIKKNEKIKEETKNLEKEYLNKKNDKIPDYSKELQTLNEIDSSLKRKEYFSVIKFLIENSEYGIDYTKIGYENKKWLIQGEMQDFGNFEKFEKNILNKYSKAELGYIKDNDTVTVFEYNILE